MKVGDRCTLKRVPLEWESSGYKHYFGSRGTLTYIGDSHVTVEGDIFGKWDLKTVHFNYMFELHKKY